VTSDVLTAMEEMSLVAPAHNPPYIKAMRLLAEKLHVIARRVLTMQRSCSGGQNRVVDQLSG